MNKVILGIVVVLAITIVGWFFYTQRTLGPTAMETPGVQSDSTNLEELSAEDIPLEGDMLSQIVVAYTSDGFKPESVTIEAGETVRFVNQSSRNMWIGSDNHPTHTNYPVTSEGDCLGSSFDTCRGIPPEGSWTFTFTEVGSWGYHNHTQAGHRGVIIVE